MKLLNTAAGVLLSKFFNRPFYVRYHITHRCNYRCRMCGQHEQSPYRGKELTLSEIRVVAKKLAATGAKHLVITGGEPFLHPHILDVIAEFREYQFSIRMQTNGAAHVTRELLKESACAGLQDISVSIDTLNRKLQDEICRADDVVENAIRTLQLAREALPHSISQANVVASRYNFMELPALVRYFNAMDIYTYITPVMAASGHEKNNMDYVFRGSDEQFYPENLDSEIRDRIIDELIDLRRNGLGLTNSTRFLEDYRAYLKTGLSDWHCEAGTLCMDVMPDGSVCVCKEKPAVTNILDSDFIHYYRSKDFFREAKHISSRCSGCFYGEYREPQYAVRDFSVLKEWIHDWLFTYRKGMHFHEH